MPFVKMKRSGNYRGKQYKEGDILEVPASLQERIVLSGQGTTAKEADYERQNVESNETVEDVEYSEMNSEQLKTVEYQELQRGQLEEFAVALKIDEKAAKDAKNKTVLQGMIAEELKKLG